MEGLGKLIGYYALNWWKLRNCALNYLLANSVPSIFKVNERSERLVVTLNTFIEVGW